MDKVKAFFTPKSKRNKLRLTLCQEESWENTNARESFTASNEEFIEQQKGFESLSVKVTSVSPRSPLSTSPVPNHFTFDFSFQPNSNHLICCSSQTSPQSPVRKWGMLSSSPLPSVQLRPRVSSTDLRASANKTENGKLKISESNTSKFAVDAVNSSSTYNTRTSQLGSENSKQHSSYESITSRDRFALQAETGSSLINAAVPNTIKKTTPKELNATENSSEKESRRSRKATTRPNVKDQKCVQSEVCNIFVHEEDGSELMSSTKDATKVGSENGAGSKNHPSYLQLEKSNTPHPSPTKSVKTHAPGENNNNIRNDGASTSLAVSSDQSEATSTTPQNPPQDHRFQRIMELDDFTRQMLEIDIIRPLSYL